MTICSNCVSPALCTCEWLDRMRSASVVPVRGSPTTKTGVLSLRDVRGPSAAHSAVQVAMIVSMISTCPATSSPETPWRPPRPFRSACTRGQDCAPEFPGRCAVPHRGGLDEGQSAFYAVAPMPEDWAEEQVRCYLRAYNLDEPSRYGVPPNMPGMKISRWAAITTRYCLSARRVSTCAH